MEESEIVGEELFIQFGVLLKKASAMYLSLLNTNGILHFMKSRDTSQFYFEWRPNENCEICDTDSQESGWSLVDTIERTSPVSFNAHTETMTVVKSPNSSRKKSFLRIMLNDLKGLEVSGKELRLLNRDGIVHSAYIFLHASVHSFSDYLERSNYIRKHAYGKYVIISKEEENEKLQKSFSELNIEDIRNSKYPKSRILNNTYTDMLYKFAPLTQVLRRSIEADGVVKMNRNKVGLPHNNLEDEGDENLLTILALRPHVIRGPPLSEVQWKSLKEPNGMFLPHNVDKIKEIIFSGGIHDSIRPIVWKYLLNLDLWENTDEEKDKRRGLKTQEYYKMKLQWLTISPVQEQNFAGYRERKCQSEKDVKRTDRTCEFFAGDNNPNLSKLQDILLTYIMYNFDLGYVQGMSDLLAPILSLMHSESESFWCFVGFMEKVVQNFDIDQKGMKEQLEGLRRLMAFSNEKLYNYLKDNESENMYFCFRWLLVWFKREFSNMDILNLWEVLLTGLPCPNYQLFICLAILDEEMDLIIENEYKFTDILKHINDLSYKINLKRVLEKAEAIYLQIQSTKHVPDDIRKIMGEQVSEENSDDESIDENLDIERSPEEAEVHQRKLEEACDMSMSFSFF